MYQFKGFAGNKTLANNAADAVSSVGELSSYCSTFAKDIKYYATSDNVVSVHGFSSKSNNTTNVEIPTLISELALEISKWVYLRQNTAIVGESRADFRSSMINEFLTKCTSMECGEMVVANNGKLYPASVTWSCTAYTAESNLNTLWFSDSSFKQQYDGYDILVVPPLVPIDSFFGPYGDVVSQLANRTYIDALTDIQVVRNNYPETILTAEEFYFVNAINPTVKIKTNWSFLIYGPKGNDSDLIKTALVDYIAAHSTRAAKVWKNIFPDIFKSTEFMLVPKWNNYAIEERSLTRGIYSPITGLKAELTYLKGVLADYPAAHVESYASLMAHPYKSMMISVVGNPDNRENKFELTDIFPDILAVSSTSLDFNRMSALTKGFLEKLSEMIILAESITEFSEIPSVYKTTKRSGVLYITVTYNNIRFLVSTKSTTP